MTSFAEGLSSLNFGDSPNATLPILLLLHFLLRALEELVVVAYLSACVSGRALAISFQSFASVIFHKVEANQWRCRL